MIAVIQWNKAGQFIDMDYCFFFVWINPMKADVYLLRFSLLLFQIKTILYYSLMSL